MRLYQKKLIAYARHLDGISHLGWVSQTDIIGIDFQQQLHLWTLDRDPITAPPVNRSLGFRATCLHANPLVYIIGGKEDFTDEPTVKAYKKTGEESVHYTPPAIPLSLIAEDQNAIIGCINGSLIHYNIPASTPLSIFRETMQRAYHAIATDYTQIAAGGDRFLHLFDNRNMTAHTALKPNGQVSGIHLNQNFLTIGARETIFRYDIRNLAHCLEDYTMPGPITAFYCSSSHIAAGGREWVAAIDTKMTETVFSRITSPQKCLLWGLVDTTIFYSENQQLHSVPIAANPKSTKD